MTAATSTTFKAQQAARSDYGSQFEILVSVLYNQIVKFGDVVVDGGANAGLHAVPLGDLVGSRGLVIAFEPNPDVFRGLRDNMADLAAELHLLALSDTEGTLSFVVDIKNPALSHIQHDFDRPSEGRKLISVRSVLLDKIVAGRKITFIKLDLEGADFLGIRGAKATLLRDRPPIIFENSRVWAAKCNGYTMEAFFAFFDEIKYDIYDLHGVALTKDNWTDEDVAFEFIALPRENADKNRHLLAVIDYFWREIDKRPVLPTWAACVLAARNARKYMVDNHGRNWLSGL